MMLDDLKCFVGWIAQWALFGVVIAMAVSLSPIGRDDSDSSRWGFGRSQLSPSTDALTGCQYLRTSGGGITPRLDANGRHVGCRK